LVRSVFPEAPDSVHLADFPVADVSKIDRKLAADTRLVMKVSSLGRAARSQAGIKVRQPLAHVVVSVALDEERESLQKLKSQIAEELNVKNVMYNVPTAEIHVSTLTPEVVIEDGDYRVAIPTEIPPELQLEGMAREIVHRLQRMRRSAGFDIADYITSCYQGDDYIRQVMEKYAAYIKQETLSRQLIEGALEEGAYTESHKLGDHEILLGVKRLG